ncbi:MAG: hypothetical protein ACFCUQ_10105 [Kiloniellales bacterium]
MTDNARRFATFAGRVPAGDRLDITRPGSYFRLIGGAAGLMVRIDDEPPGDIAVGLGVDCPEPFNRLTFINTTVADIDIEVAFARGRVDDSRLSLSGSVNVATAANLADVADVALAAGVATQIAAANAVRKELVVSNLAGNAGVMRIGTSNVGAARGIELSPGQSVVLSTSAEVYGYSVPGESVGVLEVVT